MDSPAPCPSGIVRDNLNPQASSMAPPAAPRIDSWRCDPRYSLGRNKGRFTHKFKVANRSGLVAEGSPARCAASAKRAVTTHRGIPKGAALGAPLVTFPATGKSPGVEGRSALPMGRSAEDGAQPLLALGAQRGRSPLANGLEGAPCKEAGNLV